MATVLFFFLSALCLGGVLGLILFRNPAYGALCLVVSFSSLGALFGLLDAPFIAAVQVIIYAGAVMVLFIFVLMMIPSRPDAEVRPGRRTFLVLSVLLTAVLAVEIFLSLAGSFRASAAAGGAGFGGTREVGRLLFTEFLYPFEITSLLIMAAIVGAIVLAKKRSLP